jgi:hypothetical protein
LFLLGLSKTGSCSISDVVIPRYEFKGPTVASEVDIVDNCRMKGDVSVLGWVIGSPVLEVIGFKAGQGDHGLKEATKAACSLVVTGTELVLTGTELVTGMGRVHTVAGTLVKGTVGSTVTEVEATVERSAGKEEEISSSFDCVVVTGRLVVEVVDVVEVGVVVGSLKEETEEAEVSSECGRRGR